MTQIEHYAASLALFLLIGLQLGFGQRVADDRTSRSAPVAPNEAVKSHTGSWDIFWILGWPVAIGYGIAAFEFVRGPNFIWAPAVGVALVGVYGGKRIASARHENHPKALMFGVLFVVPYLYHGVLT
jgi:hypothetical protein